MSLFQTTLPKPCPLKLALKPTGRAKGVRNTWSVASRPCQAARASCCRSWVPTGTDCKVQRKSKPSTRDLAWLRQRRAPQALTLDPMQGELCVRRIFTPRGVQLAREWVLLLVEVQEGWAECERAPCSKMPPKHQLQGGRTGQQPALCPPSVPPRPR